MMKNLQKINLDFQKILKIWEQELNNYSEDELKMKENEESWSIGQVYVHLINSALYFHLKQVDLCLNNSDNKNQKKNFKGFMAYNLLNGFPPIKIKVPAYEGYTPKQPDSKDKLFDGLKKIKREMENVLISFNQNKLGKTAHPGFSFLSAIEWYKIIEMHWRHHLRQKKRIDLFLKKR